LSLYKYVQVVDKMQCHMIRRIVILLTVPSIRKKYRDKFFFRIIWIIVSTEAQFVLKVFWVNDRLIKPQWNCQSHFTSSGVEGWINGDVSQSFVLD